MLGNVKKNTIRQGKDFWDCLRANSVMVLFALALLCGMAWGALSAGQSSGKVLDGLDFLFNASLKTRTAQSVTAVFASSFASSFLFLFASFLCGLSMWGIVMLPVVVAFRGYGLGLAAGYLYLSYGIKGFLFHFSVLLPGAFVCCLALLLAARDSASFSRRLRSAGKGSLKAYCIRFGAIMAVAFTGAILDLLTTICFAGMFSF